MLHVWSSTVIFIVGKHEMNLTQTSSGNLYLRPHVIRMSLYLVITISEEEHGSHVQKNHSKSENPPLVKNAQRRIYTI